MALTFFGVATVPADNSTNTASPSTITPPGSMTAGDLCIIYAVARASSGTLSISTTGGQSWTSETQYSGTTNRSKIFWCTFNGSWGASPQVTFGSTTCNSAEMIVFRPTDIKDTWALDTALANAAISAPGSPYLFSITGWTPAQDFNVNLAVFHCVAANTWGTLTGTNWSQTSLGAQYRNTSGSDQSNAFAYQIQDGAKAATNNVTLNESASTAGSTHRIAWRVLRSCATAETSAITETSDGVVVKSVTITENGGNVKTDDFQAYSTGNLGGQGDWVAGINDLQIADSGGDKRVYASNTSTVKMCYLNKSFPNDQYAKLTVDTTINTNSFIGPAVRCSSNNCYGAIISSNWVGIHKIIAGVDTELDAGSATIAAGDVIELYITGNTLKFLRNGSPVSGIGDANGELASGSQLTTGKIGILAYTEAAGLTYMDDLEGSPVLSQLSDTQDATVESTTKNVEIIESTGITETPTAISTLLSIIAESSANTDTNSCTFVGLVAIAESSVNTDSPDATITYPVAIAEMGAITESSDATIIVDSQIIESAGISESNSCSFIGLTSIVESAGISDNNTCNFIGNVSISEDSVNTDTQSNTITVEGIQLESSEITDNFSGISLLLAEQIEQSEISSFQDAIGVGEIYEVAIIETSAILDIPSCQTVSDCAIIETASITDSEDRVLITLAQISEDSTITSIQDSQLIIVAGINEISAITDNQTAELVCAIIESAHITDSCDSILIVFVLSDILNSQIPYLYSENDVDITPNEFTDVDISGVNCPLVIIHQINPDLTTLLNI